MSQKLLDEHQRTKSRKCPSFFLLIPCFLLISSLILLLQSWSGSCPWKAFESQCPISKFDYTLLTIRWPPGICESTDCIDNYPQQWLIHGLWPNYSNGSWPQFCCPSTPFDVEEVEPIRPQLEIKWSNLEDGKDADSLWEHEWNKHGTCSTLDSKLRGQLKYFNFTLTLFDRLPVVKWLESASIYPDPEKQYQYSQFYDAISSRFGKKFVLQCQKSGSKTYLQQMEFCFDKITFEHRNCDHQLNSASCKNGFLYTKE